MAANALQNLVREMEQRYGTMSLARTRSLPELNKARAARGEAALPYILCVIDELADLDDGRARRCRGLDHPPCAEGPRRRDPSGARDTVAARRRDHRHDQGERSVTDRVAVSSQTDSRVILDQNGAESLLGQGDMLFSPVGTNKLQRIQGAYIDEEQIAELTESWRRQGEPDLREELLEEVIDPDEPAEQWRR